MGSALLKFPQLDTALTAALVMTSGPGAIWWPHVSLLPALLACSLS